MTAGFFYCNKIKSKPEFHVIYNMKRLVSPICIIFTLFLFSACSKTIQKVEVDDFQYRTVYSVLKKTNSKHGLFEKYAPDGVLYESANYTNGALNGARKLFHENGNLDVIEHYVAGKYEGETKTYYDSGEIKLVGQYQNNVAEGIWISYYPNGKKKEEVIYANNEEQGPFKEWHENGNLKAEGTYKDGDNEHGELKLYHDDGQLMRKMDCNMGACSTTWKSDRASDQS